MTARLFSKTGETRGFEIEIDGEATIGRDSGSNLAIDRPLMSGRHARIFYHPEDGRYVLEDLDSLNGTELDGDRVTGRERLGHLHVISFAGSYDFFFLDRERCAQRHPNAPAASSRQADRPPAPASIPRETTSVEKDPVELPGFLARRADAVSPEGTVDEPREITSIEKEPAGRPSALARRADEVSPEGMVDEPREITSIEKEPAGLPSALARRADEAGGGPAGTESPEGGTVIEKLPVSLPGSLLERVEAVQQGETVDLDEIEDLIAAEDAVDGEEPSNEPAELHLVVTTPDGQVERFELVEGENLIGRSAGVKVPLTYPDLSRRHAMLRVTGDQITLRDLGSRNRTFIEDEAIDANVEVEIRPGARLRFGSVEARLVQLAGGST